MTPIEWTRITAETTSGAVCLRHGDHIGRIGDRTVALATRSINTGRWHVWLRRDGPWEDCGNYHEFPRAKRAAEIALTVTYA
jgi:hypothetical protein